MFLKVPMAPIYTCFKGERAPKECDFLVKIVQIMPKNPSFFSKFFELFVACFFQIFFQNREYLVLYESLENQFCRPKKRSSKFSKIF